MTDNVVLSAGTADGVTLATDDVAGVHYQIVKISYGALDTATAVSASAGLPVAQQGTWNVTNVSGTVSLPTGASIASKQPALGTAGAASADVLTVQGIASMTALKVDASGVAVPITDNAGSLTVDGTVAVSAVSGSVAVTQSGAWSLSANQSTNVAQVAGTATDTNSGVKSAGTLRVVLATDQPALTNKLLVTPDSVALPANQSVNVNQLAGTATDTNSGNKSAGTLRVVLATDQPALTNKLLVTPDANSAVNVAQLNGVTALMGNGVTGTGSLRVTIASDNTAFSVNSTLKPATSGGLSKFHLVSAGSTNATNVKASAGQLYGWYIYNSNAAARKVAFHNTAGTPTAGSGVTDAIVIPPGSAANAFSDIGIAFSTGIAITTVTDLTDAGTTAVAANDLVINLYYA